MDSDAPDNEEQDVEDADLKMLHAKRMLELKRRIGANIAKKAREEQLASKPKEPSDREFLLQVLIERGKEVLVAAEAAYPSEMPRLISQLVRLVKERKITTITGGELLQLFRSLGMRVSVSTSISVQQHGRFVSLADKLKRED